MPSGCDRDRLMTTQTAANDPALSALGDNAPFARTNHVRGVAAGVFAETSREFIHPEIILTGLVYAMTQSAMLAAVVPVINKVGLMAPQLLFGSRIEHLPRRQPVFVLITIVRSLLLFTVVAAIGLLAVRGTTTAALSLFYAAYLGFCISTSFAHVVFMDMIGRLIAPHRVASFIGLRQVLGGMLAMVVGFFMIQPILSALNTPWNYLLLSAIGAIVMVIDMSIWCTAREVAGAAAKRRPGLAESARRGLRWLRADPMYRKFLWTRVGFRISYLGLAFFVPFGEQQLSAGGVGSIALLGGFLVGTQKVSGITGSALWGKAADRLGSRFTLICAGLLLTAAPLLAVVATGLPTAYRLPLPGVERALDLPLTCYLLALVVLSFGTRAQILGGQRLLVLNAPPDRRPTYLSFINTLTSPLTLLPLAGAALAEWTGMATLFVAVATGGLIMLAAALTMPPDPPAAPTTADTLDPDPADEPA